MALIDCPTCTKQVSSAATACPHCGHPMTTAASTPPVESKGLGAFKTIALSIVGLVVIFLIFGAMQSGPEVDARRRERAAIDMCWEQQAKKSNPPEQAQFIAGACERMQDEFRAKHNLNP